MENLPSSLHRVLLTNLAIPGSHDSCSYSITPKSSFSMDIDSTAKEIVSYISTSSAKNIVYRWSVTQSLNVKEQLEKGIRYLDMRISYNHDEREIHVVHGLTGEKLDGILNQVKQFVTTFAKEVVIMDFNHFYSLGEDRVLSTRLLLRKMRLYLGDHLCPRGDLGRITLQYMWRIKKQVLFFLSTTVSRLPDYAWRSSANIVAPFDKAIFQDPEKWINFLTKNYGSPRPRNKFYVTQGILVPHWIEVVAGQAVNATLKTWVSQTANTMLVKWISERKRGAAGINIIIADFIENDGFIPTVVVLNSNAPSIQCAFRNLLIMFVLQRFSGFLFQG